MEWISLGCELSWLLTGAGEKKTSESLTLHSLVYNSMTLDKLLNFLNLSFFSYKVGLASNICSKCLRETMYVKLSNNNEYFWALVERQALF